ncbi:hypothetical protein EWM64_g10936 [Hericium alpestre]|uniref:Uncharacterized protein n=1 Tax=Hericium alpestre TaxID=135208 RepID=A0A4Y9ZE33_9AGAM|nr:hypothetical protein EWM64_g10936 [Hericium alpestre]
MSSKPTAENTTPEYMLRFPPWPAPPPGKKIIPFKEFKPVGIRISMDGDDDAPELDGLGIPTVPLLVKHGTDDLEKKRRKKKGGASQVTVADGKRNTWWEDWEELEDVRKKYYDPNTSPIDRVFQAGADFRGGRPWPSGQLGMRLNEQWDQFRNYVGLSPQAVISKKKQQVSDDEDSDDGEGEAAPETQPNLEASETPHPAADGQQRKRKRRPSMPVGSAYEETETADAEEGLTWDEKLQMHYEDKDFNMLKFLNDPEMNMRILFSHYFRDRGLIW